MALSSRVLTKSSDNLKPLYLHYHNVYGYQTWQDGRIHKVLIDHLTNEKPYIFTTTIPVANELGTVVTYIEEHLHIKAQDT